MPTWSPRRLLARFSSSVISATYQGPFCRVGSSPSPGTRRLHAIGGRLVDDVHNAILARAHVLAWCGARTRV
jgi:hypothetical protein